MSGQWSFGNTVSVGTHASDLVLVEGDTFCISAPNGDIRPGTIDGLFDRDTRFLSRFELLVNDAPVEFLSGLPVTPFASGVIGRGRPQPGQADSTLLVFRHRYVGRGMREDIVLRNFSAEPAAVTLSLIVDADFAHLFEVKEERVEARGERTMAATGSSLSFEYAWRDLRRGVKVVFAPNSTASRDGTLTVSAVVPARGDWGTCVQITPVMDDGPVEPHYVCGQSPDTAVPLRRLQEWRQTIPRLVSGHEGLNRLAVVGEEDLGALRIFDPDHPERAVVAAGAPWFMTLFGRDSLITSYMALLVDPSLAEGTLRTLAQHQGTRVDPLSEEEPGRIAHELRWGLARSLARGSGSLYYGTADATPLFVMLLGELRRWGLASDAVEELLPHADRALEWILHFGDRDGDGFVEYRRATDRGLANQGWKDSWDGISYANGRLADAPIALCEVQGYAYAAYLARAHFASEAHDTRAAAEWVDRAARLKIAFNDAFWMPAEGYFAVGLDGDKKLIDSVTSNVGHCLWTGIVDEDKAAAVAERLLAPDMFSGFGVRTLSSQMGLYNPVSYHNGSVWPHDNAILAAGLMRYGLTQAAHRVMAGLLDAGDAFGGRLPELFSGLPRSEFPSPVPYPTACSPQAWAAATPFSLIRTMLRLDPWIPQDKLWLAPSLPPEVDHLAVVNVPMAGGRLTVTAKDGVGEVAGAPPGLTVVATPRRALHEMQYPARP